MQILTGTGKVTHKHNNFDLYVNKPKKLKKGQIQFGKNLKRLRLKNNMSQLDLAVICNFEKTTISRIENGRANITLKTALSLSKALDINLVELFDI